MNLTGAPANFDNLGVDALVNDCLQSIKSFYVSALFVFGPDPLNKPATDAVLIAHPPSLLPVALQMASDAAGLNRWTGGTGAPLLSWHAIKPTYEPATAAWTESLRARGFQSAACITIPLVGDKAHRCIALSHEAWDSNQTPALLAWEILRFWPQLKRQIAAVSCRLSPREIEALRLAFDGLTAKESAQAMGCSERTVNFHIANAMSKLNVDSKLAAVQRAVYTGCL